MMVLESWQIEKTGGVGLCQGDGPQVSCTLGRWLGIRGGGW